MMQAGIVVTYSETCSWLKEFPRRTVACSAGNVAIKSALFEGCVRYLIKYPLNTSKSLDIFFQHTCARKPRRHRRRDGRNKRQNGSTRAEMPLNEQYSNVIQKRRYWNMRKSPTFSHYDKLNIDRKVKVNPERIKSYFCRNRFWLNEQLSNYLVI